MRISKKVALSEKDSLSKGITVTVKVRIINMGKELFHVALLGSKEAAEELLLWDRIRIMGYGRLAAMEPWMIVCAAGTKTYRN